MNLDQLSTDLQTDEGFRGYPYDDKNDQQLKAGYTIQGTPTFGFGFTFLTTQEAAVILKMRVASVASELLARLTWVASLSEPKQRALANMAYDLGIGGLITFTTFLDLVKSGQFDAAANDLLTTEWAKEVSDRAVRIAAVIRQSP